MAKRFQFDDEENINEEVNETSYIDELEKKKEEPVFVEFNNTQEYTQFDENEDEEVMATKKKKFIWKWWHYVLIAGAILCVALMAYLFMQSNQDGPVYGTTRCQGIATIPQNNIETTISNVKKEYSEVKDITFEITCKQLKVDIHFEDGMNTKKAKSIAEKAVQMLDEAVGKTKEEGKTYSQLFGYINNVAQFEVNLIIYSNDSKDFPIYGTKHVSKDELSYTLASVKDEESKEKAESTLKE